jgi:hypothetical protein
MPYITRFVQKITQDILKIEAIVGLNILFLNAL